MNVNDLQNEIAKEDKLMEEFKAGEEVFSTRLGWTTLMENENNYSSHIYPLKNTDGFTYTKEGKKLADDKYPSLFRYNPFDPNDPKNPDWMRNNVSEWLFTLNKRKIRIGDEVLYTKDCGETWVKTRVRTFCMDEYGIRIYM